MYYVPVISHLYTVLNATAVRQIKGSEFSFTSIQLRGGQISTEYFIKNITVTVEGIYTSVGFSELIHPIKRIKIAPSLVLHLHKYWLFLDCNIGSR